jgi:5-methylcytosine-specific restriction endonuclease McrA
MEIVFLLIVLVVGGAVKFIGFEVKRQNRRDYYRNDYLKSDAWQRKRYVVLRRDNWKCVYCGAKATQVHHKRYAKYNIGKEPIDWLVSICKPCHDRIHN